MERLLPPGVVVVESFGDLPDAVLLPGEEAIVARSVPARRLEFATGRACARAALERLGFPSASILRGGDGEPLWPWEA